MRAPERLFGGCVFGLEVTDYLGDDLLPGARETLEEFKRPCSVVYVTNKPLEISAD